MIKSGLKQKIGTTLDSELYQRAKDLARRQRRSINEVIEEALVRYLAGDPSRPSIVDQTRGSFRVSERVFRTVIEEDLYWR